jgi:hypothetical protein
LFIDTEFNGFGGDLISMGISADNGSEFYEVLPLPENMTPWVQENVVPVLYKKPTPKTIFQRELQGYLHQFPEFTVVADWPEDIAHFNKSLITGPGFMLPLPSFTMEVARDVRPQSQIPHNALFDARALKASYNKIRKTANG